MIIYKITNKINGKIYIGQTTGSLRKRWNSHCSNKSRCSIVSLAIQKYGKENFEIKQISFCDSLEQMNHREPYYIRLLNTLAPNGYNIKEGGGGGGKGGKGTKGHKMSEETKEKLRQANLGKRHTPEEIKKQSEAQLGHAVSIETIEKLKKSWEDPLRRERFRQARLNHGISLETREKISQTLLGHNVPFETREKMRQAKVGYSSWNRGVQVSEETKEKLRRANLGKHHSLETINKLKQIALQRKENLFINLLAALSSFGYEIVMS